METRTDDGNVFATKKNGSLYDSQQFCAHIGKRKKKRNGSRMGEEEENPFPKDFTYSFIMMNERKLLLL